MFRDIPDLIELHITPMEFRIGDVVFGGIPGVNPLVLIGSIFHLRDKKVISHEDGIFDKQSAKRVIEEAESTIDSYGLSFAVDLLFNSSKAITNYQDLTSIF